MQSMACTGEYFFSSEVRKLQKEVAVTSFATDLINVWFLGNYQYNGDCKASFSY